MRHFRKAPIDAEVMQRLFKAAHQAPSVGLMQPWRIIQIKDNALRSQIAELVEQERINTAKALGEREQEFMQLKVEGIKDCGELLVMALMDKREQYIFGRRTLPDMDLASVACAIQNMWLAARAEGLGMGWVSLFEPDKLATLLNMPEDAEPVAILCLGHVDEFYKKPMLEQENWAISRDIDEVIFTNTWSNQANT
jgi:5,6-dimethylbenzimidazole synthase